MNLNKIYFKINPKIRNYLIKPILKRNTSDLKVGNTTKEFSIDFREYVSKNDAFKSFGDYLGLFEGKDYPLIFEFLSLKLVVCNMNSIRKTNLYLEKKYRDIMHIFYKKGYYELSINNKCYKLPRNSFTTATFFHNIGLDEVPDEVIKKLEGKDFLDCGAYIGDSALILKNYLPNKIYCFEPHNEIYSGLLKTIELNKLYGRIIPIKKGVGDKRGKFSYNDTENKTPGSSSFSKKGSLKAEITTIDNFVEQINKNVGLIKMDIEGSEYDAIIGAEKTIKENKPLLIISLYHRGKDFFEIPPMLKKFVPEYKMRFISLEKTDPVNEKVLICYT